MLLEMIKSRIHVVNIPLCVRKEAHLRERRDARIEINNLQKKVGEDVSEKQKLMNEIEDSKNDLQYIRENKIKGSMFRTKG